MRIQIYNNMTKQINKMSEVWRFKAPAATLKRSPVILLDIGLRRQVVSGMIGTLCNCGSPYNGKTLVQEKWKGIRSGKKGGPIVAWLNEQVFYLKPLISTRGGEKAVHTSHVCCTPVSGWMWGKRRRHRVTNHFILLLDINVQNAPQLKCDILAVTLL